MQSFFYKLISSKSKTFLAFCFCFILGAAVASFADFGVFFEKISICALSVLFLLICFWQHQAVRFILFSIFFVLVGMLRCLMVFPENSPDFIHYYEGKTVEFYGKVIEEPDVRIDKAYYVIEAASVKPVVRVSKKKRVKGGDVEENYDSSFTPSDSENQAVTGRVLVNHQLYPQFSYGDEVKVFCNLQKPKINDDDTFRYDKYLAKQSIWVFCSNAKISALQEGGGSWIFRMILWCKRAVARKIEQLWPEPQSGFMAGILYGSRAGLPEKIMENFSRTGVTHIIAVSGSNISIIAVNLMSICIIVGMYRRKAFWLMVGLIILFVIFTGASASVVRAGIMGIIALIAERVGRPSRMTNVLVATATGMAIFNPFILLWDAGFQLSFLATIGLVYISPLLKASAMKLRIPKWSFLQVTMENLITTLAAIIATTPLILYQFGRFSVVAPLVNILILWIIPYLMLCGFLALIAGFIYMPLGQFCAGVAQWGMDYVLWTVSSFGAQEWSAIPLRIPLWLMGLSYAAMFSTTRLIKKEGKISVK
jgi:competence protein ComEC